jgi:hypothetical protein
VSASDKPDYDRVALLLRKLVMDEEARRAKMTPEERLEAEARDEELYGDDADDVPNVEELLAMARARAERDGDVAPAMVSGRHAGEVPAAGASNGHTASAAAEAPKAPAKVVPLRRRWPQITALAAAAAVIVLIGGFVLNQEPIVAHPPPWTPHDGAEQLRSDADGFCRIADWAQCKNHLDQAAALDPTGEAEEQVKRMRAQIAEAGSKQPAPGKSGP